MNLFIEKSHGKILIFCFPIQVIMDLKQESRKLRVRAYQLLTRKMATFWLLFCWNANQWRLDGMKWVSLLIGLKKYLMILKWATPRISQLDINKIINLRNVGRKEKRIFFRKIGTSATNSKNQWKTIKF